MKRVRRVFVIAVVALVVAVCASAMNGGLLPTSIQDVLSTVDVGKDAVGEVVGRTGSLESGASDQPVDEGSRYEVGCVLVKLEEGASAESVVAALADASEFAGVSVENVDDDTIKIDLPDGLSVEQAIALLQVVPGVAVAQPNYLYSLQGDAGRNLAPVSFAKGAAFKRCAALSASSTDPKRSRQWALTSINATAAWKTTAKLGASNKSVTVAVLDSGFLVTHEDLKNVIAAKFNAAGGGASVYGDEGSAAHGTHVAGIIAAQSNNSVGISGVAWNTSKFTTCKLLPIKVMDSRGYITTTYMVKAYKWLKKNARKYNVRVVNASIGGERGDGLTSGDKLLGYAINSAWNDGIVTVAAASNIEDDLTTTPFENYPSDSPNVVGVISLSRSSNADGVARSSFSNFNVEGRMTKDVSAPGAGILSTYSESRKSYESLSGTSMACPVAAGVLALEFKANPRLTAAEATSKLYSSCTDLSACYGAAPGWDRYTGYGEVNAATAVSKSTPYLSGSTMMSVGKQVSLSVKVNNKKQKASEWVWTTSNPAVATVSAKGVVKAVGSGDVIVTATMGSRKACQTLRVSGSRMHVSGCKVACKSVTYKGRAARPAPVVRDGGVLLKRGVHYKVSYSNNKKPGIGTVKIKGISPYFGTTTKKFVIKSKKGS